MSVPSGPDPLTGLSDEEAARRLEVVGPNEIATGGGRSIWQIARETMREPMFLLLMGAALLYLVVGDLGEGLFLVLGAAAAIGLVIAQEARSERALGALRELAQPRARVIRGGAERHIAARDLVPDDILLIGEGERSAISRRPIAGRSATSSRAVASAFSTSAHSHRRIRAADRMSLSTLLRHSVGLSSGAEVEGPVPGGGPASAFDP